eukprot:Gb_40289 [translate_table: standard]
MEAAWSYWECLERFNPCRSIAIGSGCIWSEFIFLATGRPRDCMEKLLECLINPGYRLGIVTICSRWKKNLARVWGPCVTVSFLMEFELEMVMINLQRVCEWQPWIVFGKTSKILAAIALEGLWVPWDLLQCSFKHQTALDLVDIGHETFVDQRQGIRHNSCKTLKHWNIASCESIHGEALASEVQR